MIYLARFGLIGVVIDGGQYTRIFSCAAPESRSQGQIDSLQSFFFGKRLLKID